ncbi:M48 family metallopeptidase [Anaeroselena agilis]|uniref:SprT family zinc-dependent metalloprotease n=1 Tax=Anaeroselena agilis TaxID=3063788 RepID=A0ABU3NWQ9_9FIRM|nr:SprT family zinc-dependent metalloprotease [Selenomonadales bacterium 4137-cl]
MEDLVIGSDRLTVTVTYSRRRTVRIRVAAADRIEVAAPLRFPEAEVAALLRGREAWIARQRAKLAAVAANPVNAAAEPGAKLLYLGLARQLTVLWGGVGRAEVTVEDERIFARLPAVSAAEQATALAAALRHWYVEQARAVLTERTAQWAEVLGVRPLRIFIREQKSRWGSCSSRGNVNYNWRVVMAPPAVVDYLVIHELCHMREANHSAAFWRLVEAADPDYREHRKWLRSHGALLTRLFADDG